MLKSQRELTKEQTAESKEKPISFGQKGPVQKLNYKHVLKLLETGTRRRRSNRMDKLVDLVKIRHFSHLGVKKKDASSYDIQLLRQILQDKRSRPDLYGCVQQTKIGNWVELTFAKTSGTAT